MLRHRVCRQLQHKNRYQNLNYKRETAVSCNRKTFCLISSDRYSNIFHSRTAVQLHWRGEWLICLQTPSEILRSRCVLTNQTKVKQPLCHFCFCQTQKGSCCITVNTAACRAPFVSIHNLWEFRLRISLFTQFITRHTVISLNLSVCNMFRGGMCTFTQNCT